MPKEENKQYTDTSKVFIRLINKNVAKEMIEKYHYSHRSSATTYAFGVFYKEESSGAFFDGEVETLIGCMTYGYPVGRLTAESISPIVKPEQTLELTRLYIKDGYGSNIESYCIALSFKWLKEFAKDIKVLVSYADPQASHLGKIYQATNWLFQGDSMRLVDAYAVRLEKDGEWLHARTVFAMYGSNSVDVLKQKIGRKFWLKLEERKYRYIYILADKKLKKRILSTLKHPILPYPKNLNTFEEEIIEVNVE